MTFTKEEIRKIAFQSKETWNDKDVDIFVAGFEKALSLFDVSKQRELLIAFMKHLRYEYGSGSIPKHDYSVDRFLKSN